MDEPVVKLIYAALLHDVGKIAQRADNVRVKHGHLGADYLARWLKENPNYSSEQVDQQFREIIQAIKHHRADEINHEELTPNSLAYLVATADHIAEGSDRQKQDFDDEIDSSNNPLYPEWSQKFALADIFTHFKESKPIRCHKPLLLKDDGQISFPTKKIDNFSNVDYAQLSSRISDIVRNIDFNEDQISYLLGVLEATCSYIPSGINDTVSSDISLYDHLKLVTAFSTCLYYYVQEHQIRDFRHDVYENPQVYRENAFLMVSFELTGLQDFIYTISDPDAAKLLRARSFYLEMMSEYFTDQLLGSVNCSRANLLYLGGAHAYLILPNTEFVRSKLKEFHQRNNDFLLENFSNSLYLAVASVEFSAGDVMQNYQAHVYDVQKYQNIFRKLTQQISNSKLHRYDATTLRKLNNRGKTAGRECRICHQIGNKDICSICRALIKISDQVLSTPENSESGYFIVSDVQTGLPVSKDKYLDYWQNRFDTIQAVMDMIDSGNPEHIQLYVKNQFFNQFSRGTRIAVGEYCSQIQGHSLTLGEMANRAQGVNRIGVLRLDVDDLGEAFVSGFSHQGKGEYSTIARTAVLSRSLGLFFKFYINYLLLHPNCQTLTHGRSSRGRKIQVIYSGGDDVFIVGAWDDVIEFAVDIRQQFKIWSDHKLTVSAGLGIFAPKFSIGVAADLVQNLENKSKEHLINGHAKDSLTLFSENDTYFWNDFIDQVLHQKYSTIDRFFRDTNIASDYGSSFVYRLLTLLHEADQKITAARWAYFLTRMEPQDSDQLPKFREFAKKLHDWFENVNERKQLECALQLYIYAIRDAVHRKGENSGKT
jgi:CRISPR-associated protein Csm1